MKKSVIVFVSVAILLGLVYVQHTDNKNNSPQRAQRTQRKEPLYGKDIFHKATEAQRTQRKSSSHKKAQNSQEKINNVQHSTSNVFNRFYRIRAERYP